MTVTNVSDAFTRADEALSKANGDWVATSTTGIVVATNAVNCLLGASHMAVYKTGQAGIQTSQITLKTTSATPSNQAYVNAGVENSGTPGTYYPYFAGPANYRWAARQTVWRMSKKAAGTSTYTVMTKDGGGNAEYAVAPAANDVMKITYDPATGVVKGYVNGTLRITCTDASPIPATQNRIGFGVEDTCVVDTWSGAWDDGAVSSTWAFTEWNGSTEVALTMKEWNGTTEVTLGAASAITEYGGSGSTLPLVQPIWSDELANSFGVGIHAGWSGTIYDNAPELAQKLIDLKVRHVRDRIYPGNSRQAACFPLLKAAGIGVHGTIHAIQDGLPLTNVQMDNILAECFDNPGMYTSIAGVNEPNDTTGGAYTFGANWSTLIRNHQKHIHDRAIAMGGGVESIRRVGPALKDAEASLEADFATMGATDIGQWMDMGDFHRYPMGGGPSTTPTPTYLMAERIGWARGAWDHYDLFVTEGGFNTADVIKQVSGFKPVSEAVQSIYHHRFLLENKLAGIKRTFIYELMDDEDPTDIAYEAHQGMVRAPVGATTDPTKWTNKPTFTNLAAFYGALDDRGGGYHPETNPFTPPQVNMKVTCGDPLFRHLVTAKRSGVVQVHAWLDKAVWNTSTRTPVTVAPVSFTIETSAGTVASTADGVIKTITL